jgi:hypothetical protein
MKMQAQKQNDELAKVVNHQKKSLVLDRIVGIALALAVVVGYGTIENAAKVAMHAPVNAAIAAVDAELAKLAADKSV